MPHTSIKGRARAAAASLILLLAVLGVVACGSSGGSSSTSAQTAANAAATSTPTTGATATGTTPSGTSSNGTSSTGTSSSSTGTTPTTPAGQPNEARYNAVRECLAQKNIVLPQRTQGAAGLVAGGNGIKVPKGMSHAQLTEALMACNVKYTGGHVAHPGSTGPGHPLPERFHRVLARFAACLRQNGVPVGEPNTSGKGPLFNTKGINTGSPQFRAAAAKCRTALFGKRPPREAGSGSATATG